MYQQDEDLHQVQIEAAATRPPMLLKLPRDLTMILCLAAGLIYIFVDDVLHMMALELFLLMIAFAVKPMVARDYWGFNIFLVWFSTSARFLDAKTWGGARPAPLPLRSSIPYGMYGRASF